MCLFLLWSFSLVNYIDWLWNIEVALDSWDESHSWCVTMFPVFQRKAAPRSVQTTAGRHSSHMLTSNAQNSPSQASTVCELRDAQAGFRKGRGTRDQIANIHWIIEKAREFPEKHLLLLHWLHESLWLCGSQHSSRDGNTRLPDLPPEKYVCRLRSNS